MGEKGSSRSQWKISFPKLRSTDLINLVVFSFASHANLSDGHSSAGSFIIFLADNDGNCCPLSPVLKIARAVKSTIAAETLAMVESTEISLYLAFILKEVLFHKRQELKISIKYNIVNHSSSDNIHYTKQVSEKCLCIDLTSLKKMLESKEITHVSWVEPCDQLSDCLNKRGASSHKLLQPLQLGLLDV